MAAARRTGTSSSRAVSRQTATSSTSRRTIRPTARRISCARARPAPRCGTARRRSRLCPDQRRVLSGRRPPAIDADLVDTGAALPASPAPHGTMALQRKRTARSRDGRSTCGSTGFHVDVPVHVLQLLESWQRLRAPGSRSSPRTTTTCHRKPRPKRYGRNRQTGAGARSEIPPSDVQEAAVRARQNSCGQWIGSPRWSTSHRTSTEAVWLRILLSYPPTIEATAVRRWLKKPTRGVDRPIMRPTGFQFVPSKTSDRGDVVVRNAFRPSSDRVAVSVTVRREAEAEAGGGRMRAPGAPTTSCACPSSPVEQLRARQKLRPRRGAHRARPKLLRAVHRLATGSMTCHRSTEAGNRR